MTLWIQILYCIRVTKVIDSCAPTISLTKGVGFVRCHCPPRATLLFFFPGTPTMHMACRLVWHHTNLRTHCRYLLPTAPATLHGPRVCKVFASGRAVLEKKNRLRNANMNERSRGLSLLHGHGTFSASSVGGWRQSAVGGWQLVAVGGWRGGGRWLWLGSWRLVAVGGGWQRLAVGGWWSPGAVLKGCP